VGLTRRQYNVLRKLDSGIISDPPPLSSAVFSLFSQSLAVVGSVASDPSDYTLGMQFSVNAPVFLTGIWWYSPPGAGVLPNGSAIYDVLTTNIVAGSLNAAPTWSGIVGSGWVKVSYPGTLQLAANHPYVVSILKSDATHNFYGPVSGFWSTGIGGAGLSNGPITAPNNANAVSPSSGQGGFNSAAVFTFPASSFGSTNYGVDVEVT
jgi:Domain of unknown function (DUF4082)